MVCGAPRSSSPRDITGATDPTYAGTQPLTINGNGHTLDGNDNSRILYSASTRLLTIDGLTLTKGSNGPGGDGAAISAGGAVTVTDSTFTNNQAGSGGAIYAEAAVTVTDSTFTNNQAASDGGAIDAVGVTVMNSTLSGNTAARGGGIAVCGLSSVVLVYATVVANSAPDGANIAGGVCADEAGAAASGDPLQSFGSVVALPQGGENCQQISDDPVGYNFSDDTSCGFSAATDKQNAGDPLLGALASSGGPTLTRLPQRGRPQDALVLDEGVDQGSGLESGTGGRAGSGHGDRWCWMNRVSPRAA